MTPVPPIADNAPCPCESGQVYSACCGSYHAGQPAPDALALMRSRYCAYALGLVDYLLVTTHRDHPEYRKNTLAWRADVAAYCRNTRFLGLAIRDFQPGDTVATVTFEARLSRSGTPVTLTEQSRFVKAGGRWLYHSGQPVWT